MRATSFSFALRPSPFTSHLRLLVMAAAAQDGSLSEGRGVGRVPFTKIFQPRSWQKNRRRLCSDVRPPRDWLFWLFHVCGRRQNSRDSSSDEESRPRPVVFESVFREGGGARRSAGYRPCGVPGHTPQSPSFRSSHVTLPLRLPWSGPTGSEQPRKAHGHPRHRHTPRRAKQASEMTEEVSEGTCCRAMGQEQERRWPS